MIPIKKNLENKIMIDYKTNLIHYLYLYCLKFVN